jgi:uncharacterized protein
MMRFEHAGRENTDSTLRAALARALELNLGEVVLASSTGETALKAVEIFKDRQLTVVTYHCGFKEPFQAVMPAAVRTELESKGVRVISATHALSGVERSLAKKLGGALPVLVMAETLRLFGQGTKVAVEIAVMAADGGALSGADIIAIGGSGRGADTALVLKPAGQSDLLSMQIREIICKPMFF